MSREPQDLVQRHEETLWRIEIPEVERHGRVLLHRAAGDGYLASAFLGHKQRHVDTANV